MHRLTISLEEELAQALDGFVRAKGYQNRSEAIRDMIRERLDRQEGAGEAGQHSVAVVSYLYNHHERSLSKRLTEAQHDHHDLGVSTLHVHLGHEECLEVTVLRGATSSVRGFANDLVTERGVRHGHVHLVPMDQERAAPGSHQHVHYRTRT